MRARPGFNLLELVIVIVILSVIAAIAVPRMSSATSSARANRLVADLRRLQTSVDHFDAEHDLPLGRNGDWTVADAATVMGRLTGHSHADGSIAGDGMYGPYLLEWPVNPINDSAVLVVTTADIGSDAYGWRLNPETSEISASVVGGSTVDLGGSVAKSGAIIDTGEGGKILDGTVSVIGGLLGG